MTELFLKASIIVINNYYKLGPFDFSQIPHDFKKTDRKFMRTFGKDWSYKGETIDGKADGRGALINDRYLAVGFWKND